MVVEGLSFERVQRREPLQGALHDRFIAAVRALEARGVHAITGDCGFMLYLQPLARQATRLPIFLSALVQLPAVVASHAPTEQIAILTANGESLVRMQQLIKAECGGVDLEHLLTQTRFLVVGCESVPGFEAVALGQRVDVARTTPGIVALVRSVHAAHPALRALLLECTELPQFADHLRSATGLPVYDAITAADFYMSSVQDNPRFGLDGWRMRPQALQVPSQRG